MKGGELDSVDRHILAALQRDGRATMTELAAEIPVSANTVRNRIQAMESAGVVEGYAVEVNYSAVGYPLHYQYTCSAPISDRSHLADAALEVPGVLSVRELMTGVRNVLVEAICTDQDDITRIARTLDELGLEVTGEALVKMDRHRPLSLFDDE